MVICVTGNSGSGKSTFARILASKIYFRYIDVDVIARSLYSNKKMLKSLIEAFGVSIIDSDGNVVRSKVGAIALKNKENAELLNKITWGYIERRIDKAINNYTDVVLDYKFLPITKYYNIAEYNIYVTADEKTRRNKIIERDNITEEYLDLRENNSPDFSKFKFDYILKNDYTSSYYDRSQKIIDNISKKIKASHKK